ncbi:MAG: TolC family protein [Lysobacterales bacterium]|jgi:outer membrane protein TolC|nr:MAG: TolC family protein [Xanthomonadales bacterium]
MKVGVLRVIVASLFAGAMCARALGAETLEDAWVRALEADRGLAAARSQAEAAELDAAAARAQRWPTIAVGGSYTWLDESPAFDFSFTGLPITAPPLFGGDDFAMGQAAVSVPIYTGGRITSGIAAAEARGRGVGAQAVGAAQDVKLAVAETYVGVLRARKALAVADSNVRSLEALAGDIGAMFESELVPKNELLAVEVALADARQNRLRAANAAEIAQAAYNRRLGEPLDRPADLAEAVPAPDALPAELDVLLRQALERRTELAALGEQAEAYGQLARVERSRVLPQLSVNGGYTYLENQFLDDETVATAGVGVQWALFDGGQSRKRAAALERNRRATQEQRADVESMIALQVRQAWLDVEETRQRVGVSGDAVGQAEENLRIARERYGAGLGTQTQLLEAETLRVRALTNRDDAVLDAALARLRLARAAGVL